MGKRTRIRCKIGSLPPELKSSVEQMIMTPQEYTYKEIADFLAEHGYDISYSAVYRYSKRMNADLQMAVMNQENLRRVTEAMHRYPDLDYVEVLLVITAQKLIDRIQSAPDDQWDSIHIEDAITGIMSLARTKTYKRRTENMISSKEEAGMNAALSNLFDALNQSNPELYHQIYDVAQKQLEDCAQSERMLGGTE